MSAHMLSVMVQGVQKDTLLPKFVLEVDSIHDVPPSRGEQIIPNFRRPGGALGEAFGKERALLQVCSPAADVQTPVIAAVAT